VRRKQVGSVQRREQQEAEGAGGHGKEHTARGGSRAGGGTGRE
jgi:hypothetical protein